MLENNEAKQNKQNVAFFVFNKFVKGTTSNFFKCLLDEYYKLMYIFQCSEISILRIVTHKTYRCEFARRHWFPFTLYACSFTREVIKLDDHMTLCDR